MNVQNAYDYLTEKKVFSYEKAALLSKEGALEGAVLLKNENGVLPLKKGEKVAFFGRMQKHYLMSGTGSGGRVQTSYVTNIFDSLKNLGVALDKNAEEFYDEFAKNNPYDYGDGWSNPSHQNEPEITEELTKKVKADSALYIITRISGEAADMPEGNGGYLISETEEKNIRILRKNYKKLTVILNISEVMDMNLISDIADAILVVWHGGLEGGSAAAEILCGKRYPSGRLPDTVSKSLGFYPSYKGFFDENKIIYSDDIFVGYRYFETFMKDGVLYPFGFGLDYTSFSYENLGIVSVKNGYEILVKVKNIGDFDGKATIQCYITKPVENSPVKELCGFFKTKELKPGDEYIGKIFVNSKSFEYFDENLSAYVVKSGKYTLSVSENVRKDLFTFDIDIKNETARKVVSALAPVENFEKLERKNGKEVYSSVKTRVNLPEPTAKPLKKSKSNFIHFDDVANGKYTVEEFVSTIPDRELIHMVRAEGMSSPKVTPGTAAAFVGVTPKLVSYGLPVLCCTDGPSGVRRVSDDKCVCYPDATCIASSWNEEIAEKMYFECGNELATNGVDMLLGPGINIHRLPLCGRNFEYFSEDPFLTGKQAAAICRGLSSAGISGVIKHFACNNREQNRHGVNSVVSERAIREIYTKAFEIVVNESDVCAVMTSYNPVNGDWAASNYDLNTRLLRNDYNFKGFIMTDWWAKVTGDDGEGNVTNLCRMIHAGNDIYMVTPDAEAREDNLEEGLKSGKITRGELEACAVRLSDFALKSLSYTAKKNGLGARDLKSECEKLNIISYSNVESGVCTVNSDKAKKAILRFSLISGTDELTQTNISVRVNTKRAADFIIGGTNGKVNFAYREISLVSGENKFEITSDEETAKITEIACFG